LDWSFDSIPENDGRRQAARQLATVDPTALLLYGLRQGFPPPLSQVCGDGQLSVLENSSIEG
jgi:hypothetical protein